jgi:glutamyl-tRNA synthetase
MVIPPDETIGKNENLVLIDKAKENLYRLRWSINKHWLGLLCFDSAEALDAARKEQEEQGKTFI